MADIREKIYEKYSIDISKEKLLEMYKIDKESLTDSELQQKFDDAKKRWSQSVNGPNERNAKRDGERLNKANTYETILKDSNLRKELFSYYASGEDSDEKTGSQEDPIVFAREYFKLVETTKKVKKQDVDFFFEYYQGERKYKKDIYTILEKEFKVRGITKSKNVNENDANEDDTNEEGKKKNESSPLIVNLFQKPTIINLRKCIDSYEISRQNQEIIKTYPEIGTGLYDFLGLNSIKSIEQFSEMINKRVSEAFKLRQEKGTDYISLVDLYNMMKSLLEYRDVVDNLPEFKLLIKYPTLTPYMYSFLDMKPATIKGLIKVAQRDYRFRDDSDFILNYYEPVHDNFGISDSGISSIVKKAKKSAAKNKIINKIDEALGRNKKRSVPIFAELIHWLIYWPIFAVYFEFEVCKAIFTELHRFVVPVFLILFIGLNVIIPMVSNYENLLVLRYIIFPARWSGMFSSIEWPGLPIGTPVSFLSMLYAIVSLLGIYVLPPLCVAAFVKLFSYNLNEYFDWVGYERTFQHIFKTLHDKTENQYVNFKGTFFKKAISKILTNIICLAILIAALILIPMWWRTVNGQGGSVTRVEETSNVNDDTVKATTTDMIEEPQSDIEMVIEASAANIRSGPGTDYGVITTANGGDVLIATGNQETDSNGRIWYEIYLNEERDAIGWASEKVISFVN